MTQTVLVFGAGTPNGIGGAISMRFAEAGFHVLVTGRTQEKVEQTAKFITSSGRSAGAMVCDVTQEGDVGKVFDYLALSGQSLAAVIYNAGNNAPTPFEDITSKQFENFWRVGRLGAFHVAKRAMPILRAQGHGSMFFTGASASLRGRPNFAHFASAKGALRNLAQALSQEYGPKGVHVAHIIIDGAVNGDRIQALFADRLQALGEDGALDPAAIAETFLMVHQQHRSAWTHELDLRPYKEAW